VQERPDRVHGAGAVPRKQLQRKERRPAGCRALVFEAATQELELLAEPELPDRAIGDGSLTVVRAASRGLELVVPLSSKLGDIEYDRRIELDIRRDHVVGLALAQRGKRRFFQRRCDLEAWRAQLLGRALEDSRAWILRAVDAMAEAHDPPVPVEQVLDVGVG